MPSTIDLREWIGLAAAARETGYTPETLRHKGDAGKIRVVRDPVGRRLVHRKDIEALKAEREKARTSAAAS